MNFTPTKRLTGHIWHELQADDAWLRDIHPTRETPADANNRETLLVWS